MMTIEEVREIRIKAEQLLTDIKQLNAEMKASIDDMHAKIEETRTFLERI